MKIEYAVKKLIQLERLNRYCKQQPKYINLDALYKITA